MKCITGSLVNFNHIMNNTINLIPNCNNLRDK